MNTVFIDTSALFKAKKVFRELIDRNYVLCTSPIVIYEFVKVIDELDPQPEDIIVEKRMLSGFFGSDLDFTLRNKGTDTLIVTGVATWACVLKTAFDAVELGYQVMVPADCCSSPNPQDHEAALTVFKALRVFRPSVEEVIDTL